MRTKVFFVHNINSSWVDRDRVILNQTYDVTSHFVNSRFKVLVPPLIQILRNDFCFLWFGSLQFLPIVFLAKLFNKPIFIIAGGFDVANVPSVHYGAFTQNKISVFLRRWIFKSAHLVLCVSKANQTDTLKNVGTSLQNTRLLYHGFEALPESTQLTPWHERKNQVILISQALPNTFFRKGIDQFLQLAKLCPEYKFVHMGYVSPEISFRFQLEGANNFSSVGPLPFRSENFNKILNESKFIAQLSVHESFGCSVVDGALMGCIPLVYGEYALAEIAEGFIESPRHGELNKIRELMLSMEKKHPDVKKTSEYFLNKFPLKRRTQLLLNYLNESGLCAAADQSPNSPSQK